MTTSNLQAFGCPNVSNCEFYAIKLPYLDKKN